MHDNYPSAVVKPNKPTSQASLTDNNILSDAGKAEEKRVTAVVGGTGSLLHTGFRAGNKTYSGLWDSGSEVEVLMNKKTFDESKDYLDLTETPVSYSLKGADGGNLSNYGEFVVNDGLFLSDALGPVELKLVVSDISVKLPRIFSRKGCLRG